MHLSPPNPVVVKTIDKMSSSQAAAPAAQFYVSPAVQHLSVHLDTFLHQNPNIDRVAVGGLIFHPNAAIANSPRLLLLQRSSSSQSFPRVWEIPGGTCQASDETILHSLVRKVSEETGLQVNNVVTQVLDTEYLTLRDVRWAKMCFLLGVDEVTGHEMMEDVPVRTARSEYRASRWASRDAVEEVEVVTEGCYA